MKQNLAGTWTQELLLVRKKVNLAYLGANSHVLQGVTNSDY